MKSCGVEDICSEANVEWSLLPVPLSKLKVDARDQENNFNKLFHELT
jgi:hypothetical protein